ncbi:MAG: hypothetical protein M3342_10490 [Bacteroidota bacterium]|nr:hypothetical protein [Bacteroidota bacterium]
MESREKIASVTINVPFRSAGNIIKNRTMEFEVWKENAYYKAIPLCSYQDRVLANLPPELVFEYRDGNASSTRGIKDGNIQVIRDIALQLKATNVVA